MKPLDLSLIILTVIICCSCKTIPSSHKNNSSHLSESKDFVGQYKSKVAILGMFHLANPGLDEYKQKHSFDIFSNKRQAELKQLLAMLVAFKPTKIIVEQNRITETEIINNNYIKYVNNQFDISKHASETYQIGFQLAKQLKHKKIYLADAKHFWTGVNLDWETYDSVAYMKSKGQFNKISRYDHNARLEKNDALKSKLSLIEYLQYLNKPANTLKDNQMYLNFTLEGAGDNYLGADTVSKQYRRNLKIFSNIYDFTDFDKPERLLVIFGISHVYQLKQFFKDSPDFDYIEINDVLVR